MADGVVVLHGIFRTHRSMRGLFNFLEKSGFSVLNVNYPSTKHSLESLADIIHPQIESFSKQPFTNIHFVGYSMGGLLIRAYLKKYRPKNLGRVVMIATPNKGSEVADFLKNLWLYKKLYGPAGQQLITRQEDFSHIFAKLDCEFGIIYGDKPVDLISSKIIGKTNDGKVSTESALLERSKDQIMISTNHTYFPSNKKAWKQTLSFLQTGVFDH